MFANRFQRSSIARFGPRWVWVVSTVCVLFVPVLLLCAVLSGFDALSGGVWGVLAAALMVAAMVLVTFLSVPAVVVSLLFVQRAFAGDERARNMVLGVWWVSVAVFAVSLVGAVVAVVWLPAAVSWTVVLCRIQVTAPPLTDLPVAAQLGSSGSGANSSGGVAASGAVVAR